MKHDHYLELIELYETLVNVVCDLGNYKKNQPIRKHLLERRTELLGQIEDQREKLQINQF